MVGIGEKIGQLFEAPESIDPADVDALGDDTGARKRPRTAKKAGVSPEDIDATIGSKRLRLRPKVPVIAKYKGKAVERKDVFGCEGSPDIDEAPELAEDDSVDGDLEDDLAPGAGLANSVAGSFTISGDVEAEYEKMLRETQSTLEIMKTPSTGELAKKKAEAECLKQQLSAWNALVEFRIHLESALSIGHRLPKSAPHFAFRKASDTVAKEFDNAAGELRDLLGKLLALQQKFGSGDVLSGTASSSTSSASRRGDAGEEPEAWAVVDDQLQRVFDGSLKVADRWKESTRLDAKRSFKVLNQSLDIQMQSVMEVEPEKLKQRCTPVVGKHKVFGTSIPTTDMADDGREKGVDEAEAKNGKEEPFDLDIYEDREFYVQLLREVLASGGANDSGLTGDKARELQVELQGRRALKKRAKNEVERRASKGRKIRYVPIEKLQNFMAPKPRWRLSAGASEAETMREDAAEALLRALFSKSRGA